MTDILIPPWQPSVSGTSADVSARVLTSKYGDGFKQDAADGVNALERKQTLNWDPISLADANTIEAFLEAHVGVPFYYRLPRELAPRSWIWMTKTRTHPYPQQDALSVNLEERYIF